MTPRTTKLNLDEIIQLQEEENEGWQEQIKNIARGEILGFMAEIVPEEVPGYGVLPDREFKIRLLDRVHALFNAIKHVLAKAAAAAGERDGQEHAWDEWITVKRKDALVRVYRTVENGKPTEMPEVFTQTILATQSRFGRGLPRKEGASERRVAGRLPNRAEPSRDGAMAG